MKFLSSLVLVTGAVASVIKRQDDLPAAIGAIQTATEGSLEAVNAYEGSDEEFAAVTAASAGVAEAITAAQAVVDGIDSIEGLAAISLSEPTMMLNEASIATLDAIVAKQATFAENDHADEVLAGLQAQQEIATALSESIVSKLPEALQAIGAENSAPAAEALQNAIDAFAGAADSGDDTTDDDDATSTTSAGAAPATSATSAAGATYATEAYPTPSATGDYDDDDAAQPTHSIVPYDGAGIRNAAGLGAIALAGLVVAF